MSTKTTIQSLDSSPLTTFAGPTIEAAWNPARRRSEPIFPEDEGYDEAKRRTLHWCPSAGTYVSIPR